MGKKQVKVMLTAFRDGFQSVFGARVLTKDYMPRWKRLRAVSDILKLAGPCFKSLFLL